MSSALKDARWRLAEVMAEDDGVDFHEARFDVKELYLGCAQSYLRDHGDTEMIERLAAQFREGS